jgi:integrase
MQFTFNKTWVEKRSAPDSAREWHADTKITGLRLCVFRSGIKVFYLSRKIDGRHEKIKLGRYPALSVESARTKARQLIGSIAHGQNPARDRRHMLAESTFAQLFAWYLEEYAKAHKRTWKEDESKYKTYLSKLAHRKLSALSRRDFASIHTAISKTGHPVTANRVIALASSVFGQAIRAEKWVGVNPCLGLRLNSEKSRDRFLKGDELRRFLAAVQAEPNETMRDYVMVSLLTGARRGNVTAMRWDQIALNEGEWRIPGANTKNGNPLTLPLAPAVVQILRQRNAVTASPWVFPASRSDSKHGYLRGTQRAWQRILDNAGISDLRLHDLRHTFASWQVRTGSSLHMIGKTLGHLDSSSTAIYANVDIDPMRASVERSTAAMLAEGKATPKADVEPLRSKG